MRLIMLTIVANWCLITLEEIQENDEVQEQQQKRRKRKYNSRQTKK